MLKQAEKQTEKQTDHARTDQHTRPGRRQSNQTGRQPDRQTDRHSDGQAGTQAETEKLREKGSQESARERKPRGRELGFDRWRGSKRHRRTSHTDRRGEMKHETEMAAENETDRHPTQTGVRTCVRARAHMRARARAHMRARARRCAHVRVSVRANARAFGRTRVKEQQLELHAPTSVPHSAFRVLVFPSLSAMPRAPGSEKSWIDAGADSSAFQW